MKQSQISDLKSQIPSPSDPPPSPELGAPSLDEGEASNSGSPVAPVAAELILQGGTGNLPVVAGDPPDTSDRKAQLEALRQQIQTQHSNNQKLLQSILEVEQASGWANHPAALNSVCQILDETKEFHSWLLQLQLKMTFATLNKKK